MFWNLGVKFSLLLALVALLGSGLTTFTLSNHLNSQAEQAVKEQADIVLTAMRAARNYTQDNVRPLLETQLRSNDDFIRESVPNFAARTVFNDFQQQDPAFQDFLYKEAAPNPTNSSDLADDFELKIFEQLQQSSSSGQEILSGYRTLDQKTLFYLARPLRVNDASCLACHGDPAQAPKILTEMYGTERGFGWELNDLVATQMVYVPADQIFDRGRQQLLTVTKTLFSIFGALFLLINLLLWRTVIKPIKTLTHTAKQISLCPVNPPQASNVQTHDLEPLTLRQDEPGQLARAFQYMVHVLGQREQDLQQAVQLRTQSLEQEMNDRQTAQEALQTYAHAINHDLRNLVMGISSLVQGILFRASTEDALTDNTTTQELRVVPSQTGSSQEITVEPMALTLVQKSCERQLNLMNTLMDVQSADAIRLTLKRDTISLRQLTHDVEIMYAAKQRTSDFSITNLIAEDLPKVQVDLTQLQRVFENLIDNALKYNPDGVAVIINATIEQPSATTVRCTVSDDGIGIPPEIGQKLFQLYTRGQKQAQPDGFGLGLYICQKIVTAHGGQIGVDRSEMGGAEFWFTLPL